MTNVSRQVRTATSRTRKRLIIVGAAFFLSIEVLSVLGGVLSEGYFISSREERLFRDAQWQVVKVNKIEHSLLEGEEFIPHESVWTIPGFSERDEFQAGLIRPDKSGWIQDARRHNHFEVKNDILKVEFGEFRFLEINRKEMTLGVLDQGKLTPEYVQFESIPLPEGLQTPWFLYLWHLIFHTVWIVPFTAIVGGYWYGNRVTDSTKRAWWTTAIATSIIFTILATIIATITTFVANRHVAGASAEIYGPPIYLVLFTFLSLPIAVVTGFVRVTRLRRDNKVS